LLLAGIDESAREEVREWVLRFGEPDARAFALRELGQLPAEAVRAAVADGLDSGDARIQAWALSEARTSRIPDAMQRLIEALDSERPEVVEAARGELSSFNLAWLLANLERITPAEGGWVSRLLRKINPNLVEELTAELRHPIRRHRIRAAYAARVLRLQQDVLPALLQMLADTDAPVRRIAVDVLTDVPTTAVQSALRSHADDPSARVREAVEAALAREMLASQEAVP
jgi:HEAT repeat protein